MTDFNSLIADECTPACYLEWSGINIDITEECVPFSEPRVVIKTSQPCALPPGLDQWIEYRQEAANERAHERQLASYYGGGGPTTIFEQLETARELK